MSLCPLASLEPVFVPKSTFSDHYLFPIARDCCDMAFPTEVPHFHLIDRASIERLADNGAYLVENGFSLFLYLGLQVDAGWIKDIFDADSLQQVSKLCVEHIA